ncbi:MAG TPA: site-2 protease family protein [Candidatus Limnocylindrales bacterium]|nr:site-2 protease family protein [Candidatus Limnocylindrales bacterium]
MAAKMIEEENRAGFHLFKIAGIQITLDYSWLIVFALVVWSLSAGYFPHYYPGQSNQAYWIAGLIAAFLFFLSILIHELSHSLVAIRFGIKIPEIILFIFGGISRLSEEAKDPKTELKIAFVGPLSSFALALIFRGMKMGLEGSQPSLSLVVLDYLIWINVAVGIFNLIPGFPLDGGRILRALWWWRTGSLTRATQVASNIGKGFALTLMILGGFQIFMGALIGGLWFIFIGMFLRGIAESGYQELIIKQSLEGVQVQEVMIQEVISIPPELPLRHLINEYFLRYGYRGFPVVQEGKVLGIVSIADVKDFLEGEDGNRTVEEVMIPISNSILIAPEASLAEALKKMVQEGVSRLLVVREDKMVGMITKTGLLRFLEIRHILET